MSGPFAPLTNQASALEMTVSNAAKPQEQLPQERLLAARNIRIEPQQISMEVRVQGHWQSTTLTLSPPQPQLAGLRLESAEIRLGVNGQLQLRPSEISLNVDKAQLLYQLVSALAAPKNSGTTAQTLQLAAYLDNQGRIQLPQLAASLQINNATLALLGEGTQALAVELSLAQGQSRIQAHLVLNNQTRLPLPLADNKLMQWLVNSAPRLELTPQTSTPGSPTAQSLAQLLLTLAHGQQTPLTQVVLRQGEVALLQGQPQPVMAKLDNSGQLQLQLQPPSLRLNTQVPTLAGAKAPMPDSGELTATPPTTATGANAKANTLKTQLLPQVLSWQAALYNKLMGAALQDKSHALPPSLLQSHAKGLLTPLLQVSPMHPLPETGQEQRPLRSAMPVVPNQVRQQAPLLALIVQMQGLVRVSIPAHPSSGLMLPGSQSQLQPGPVKDTTSSASLSAHVQSNKVAALTPLPLTQTLTQTLQKLLTPGQQLRHHLTQLDTQLMQAPKELQQLVNQAFAKMIGPHTPSVQNATQIRAQLQPWTLSPQQWQSSLSARLDQLVTALVAAPISDAPGNVTQAVPQAVPKTNNGLLPLLQLLLGNSGKGPEQQLRADNLLQQLQSPAAQALIDELAPIQQQMTPQLSAQLSTQPGTQTQVAQQDSNALVQLLLPMRLPPDVGHSELTLGRYQKKNNQGETHEVWFVRMQFDYGKQGELSVQAQLSQQQLNCALKAGSHALSELAQQHSEDLRRNLQQHGLSVPAIEVQQVSEQQARRWQAFYRRHSIVNLKV
ncbi:flagellar hook-length control protein FliK [Pseudoalteromonas sp. BDTF-M6]|uniref:flagellar hook-length control protein FliK n=1 Tax=Pseudoalteromonas sp. BDTF-M6 TaxID=2796132 RepID=UPI001BAEFE43|nr:flagellar hook-length control protein FliK [Pseudoalteromonas sp. BDTF-M6]MBS3798837.1 flagellar hook-length control protein FliK [Pseudoalteromonas sp. BDTF-M6]